MITQKTQADKENTYSIMNVEAVSRAARELSDRAFKLYIRMNLHQQGFAYGLSPREILNTVGMSEGRYRSARQELEAKDYLSLVEGKKNLYTFFEYPQKDNPQARDSSNVNHADLIGQPSEIEQIAPGIPLGIPAVSGGEILQNNKNNTGNSIQDITKNITDTQKHKTYPSFQDLMKKRERERQKEFEAKCHEEFLSCLDEDERPWYSEPQSDQKAIVADDFFASYEGDDADLPF